MSGTTTSGPTTTRLRAARPWVIVFVLVLVCALGLALATTTRSQGGRLDPGSPAPPGSKALAQILADQGVEVNRITQSSSVASLRPVGGTLLVARASYLSDNQLASLARTSNRLVLVEPDEETLRRLAPGIVVADYIGPALADPDCTDPDATAAGRAQAGNMLYRVIDPGFTTTICYPSTDVPGAGSYIVTGAQGRPIVIIGQGSLLTNEELASEGNAALALRALGRTSVVSWYLPDPLEANDRKPTSLTGLLPPVVWWVIAQLVLVVLLTMLWRGRRLGRLVSEPLPVVVQAAETQLGRARLYRQARARGRAADTLRTVTLRRLAQRLAAPQSAGPDQVVTLIAGALHRPPVEIGYVLLGPSPQTDLELVNLAERLDELERLATPQLAHKLAHKVPHPAATSAGDRRS